MEKGCMKLDDWQRIEKIVRWTGLSVNSFALNIGLNRGENLYQIKKGNNGISKELAELIASKYPEISKGWIITGEGDMLVCNTSERSLIPVYDIDAVCLAAMNTLPSPASMMSLPRIGRSSFAALVLNRAMEPDIPNGSLAVFAQVRTEEIIPGYPYLVVTDRITALRKVMPVEGGGSLKLQAANPDYGDMTVELYEVRRLYIVRAHIHYNF